MEQAESKVKSKKMGLSIIIKFLEVEGERQEEIH